jgi:RsiW-degrading membrane proteinase PrsW (M82 family)
LLRFAALAALPVPAALWFFYYRWKDRLKPEPLWLLLRTFLLGAASAFLSVVVYVLLDRVGVKVSEERLAGPLPAALATAAAIGVAEEGAKFFGVFAFVFRRHEFDEEFDGFVYAGVAALGFASVENFFLLQRMSSPLVFTCRALVSPITHALISAPWGVGLARARLSGRRWPIVAGLATSAVCHGAYDLGLYLPSPFRLGSAAVIAILWAWMLWKADRHSGPRPQGSGPLES